MQRRTFLQACTAFVAGAYVPTIKVNPKVELESLLGNWVDTGGYLRYDLGLPFVVERYGFATDSYAAVRIVLDEPNTNSPERRLPNMLDVWNTLDKPAGQWQRLPKKKLVRHRDGRGYCPVCLADGAIINCPKCGGEGFVVDGQYSGTCPLCDADCQISNGACPTCRGKPFGDYTFLQPFGDTLISELYASRLRKIPGEVLWCRSANQPPTGHHNNATPILFRSEIGIEGIIMPVTP